MYRLNVWASKIQGFKNSYNRLQWLHKGESSTYVTPEFIEAAKKALIDEHKATVAFLDAEKKKLVKNK